MNTEESQTLVFSEKQGELSALCENIFNKNNYKEKGEYNLSPGRMVYETEIWMIASDIQQHFAKQNLKKLLICLFYWTR